MRTIAVPMMAPVDVKRAGPLHTPRKPQGLAWTKSLSKAELN